MGSGGFSRFDGRLERIGQVGRMLHTEDKCDWDDRLNRRRRKIIRKGKI